MPPVGTKSPVMMATGVIAGGAIRAVVTAAGIHVAERPDEIAGLVGEALARRTR